MGRLPKDNKVIVMWDKTENDIMYRAGKGCLRDLRLFHYFLTSKQYTSKGIYDDLEDSFQERLIKLGYDLKTLRIEIEKR